MTFNALRSSHTHQPLFRIGGYPVDMTNLLVGLHAITALIFTFASGWLSSTWATNLVFSTVAISELRIWTLVTYPFVHEIDLWFAIGLYFFWRFGGEVETVLGTKRFAWLYLALTALPALGLFVISPLIGSTFLVGESSVHFAVFVAFALIYPNAAMWFGILAKWFVIFIVGVQSLQYLGYKSWTSLSALWISILTAFVFLHWQGAGSCHAITAWFGRKVPVVKFSKPRPSRPSTKGIVPSIGGEKRIDAILDKISTSGFQSLTPEEKAILNETSNKYSNRKS